MLDRYVSSSAGIHRPLDTTARERSLEAYRLYLRSWVPEGREQWVDLGCGQGVLLELASSFGFANIVGVDTSPEMVALAQQSGLNVRQADVFDYVASLPDASCDVISAFDLVEHLSRDAALALLRQVRRALKPGGAFLLKLPNAESPWGFWVTASDLTHEAAYSARSLQQLANLAGFPECQVREVGPVGARPRQLARRFLWQAVRQVLAGIHTIETGSRGSGIYTRVMMARLT